MSFFTHWQPLHNEDAHTALVFGYLRHAPAAHGLEPWLTATLGRPVTAPQLEPESFWPAYLSGGEGQQRTLPDLAFDANDGERLLVLVEVKPGFLGHDFDQISREIIDAHTHTGGNRIALIMVGADRNRPAATLDWETRLAQGLVERELADVEAELRYSSWAALGRTIADSAGATSGWSRYASDVLTHLRRKQLLSYEGAPVIDDLEGGLTLGNAVEVFNRCVRAAHLLLVEIRDNPRLNGLADPGGRGLQMGRDSYSTVLTQPVEGFTTTTLICAMRRQAWPNGAGVFVGFDLVHEDGPQLVVGAYDYRKTVAADIAYGYANSEPGDPRQPALAGADRSALAHGYVLGHAAGEFLCAQRPWAPQDTHGGDDVSWVLDRLDDSAAVWDRAVPASPAAAAPVA